MNSIPSLSIFFCDDYRIERSGKPMALGILGPVISVEDVGDAAGDEQVSALCIATHSIFPETIDEAELNLELIITSPGKEPVKITRNRSVSPDEANLPWGTFIPLRFNMPMEDGSIARAEISSGEAKNWTELRVDNSLITLEEDADD